MDGERNCDTSYIHVDGKTCRETVALAIEDGETRSRCKSVGFEKCLGLHLPWWFVVESGLLVLIYSTEAVYFRAWAVGEW